jgi:hypothetical protein
MEQYGAEAKLTDLPPALVGKRPKTPEVSVHHPCRAVYDQLNV